MREFDVSINELWPDGLTPGERGLLAFLAVPIGLIVGAKVAAAAFYTAWTGRTAPWCHITPAD